MHVRMEDDERQLFAAFLLRANSYVEFGAGGSTFFASSLMSGSITTVDSSRDWLNKVADACTQYPERPQPVLVHIDIGPTGDWGWPIDQSRRDYWPQYATAVWSVAGADAADLYLIDGRFRVSCFVETLLRCRADAVILIHDFAERVGYHAVRDLAREIAVASSLSAFVPKPNLDLERTQEILKVSRYTPD
jgi:hypothetical protein